VTQDDARQGLDLDVAQGGLLDLGEVADLRLREPDVGQVLRTELADAGLDLRRA
jgi:hypothetical protein